MGGHGLRRPGVIWHGNKLIDGVAEVLQLLRQRGLKLIYCTNKRVDAELGCVSEPA